MFDLIQNGNINDLSGLDTAQFNLDSFDFDDWNQCDFATGLPLSEPMETNFT